MSSVRLVYPYAIGAKREANIRPMRDWFASFGIPLVNESLQSQAYPTMPSQSANPSTFPRLSLGPGQRFASKGAYIARFDGDTLVADSEWIVP